MKKTDVKYYDDGPYLRSFERRLTRVEEQDIQWRYHWARTDLMHIVEFTPSSQESGAHVPVKLMFGPHEAFEVKRPPRE